jgi:antitoxin YefM
MFTLNATDVRQNWSAVMESVVREKPRFIRRTRDYMVLADVKLIENLLSAYHFTADRFTENDGSVTLSLRELDLAENARTEAEARKLLGKSVLEYAEDFYNEFTLWSAAPNRKSHIPYVLKALIMNNADEIGDSIKCQPGKS